MVKKKYPSQIRYEQNNPFIGCRVPLGMKNIIDELKRKTGKPISLIFRETLMTADKLVSDAYQKAINEWALWHFCAVCGQAIYIQPNSNAHKAIIQYMRDNNWGHPSCHNQ